MTILMVIAATKIRLKKLLRIISRRTMITKVTTWMIMAVATMTESKTIIMLMIVVKLLLRMMMMILR